jgi:hypothetical protein
LRVRSQLPQRKIVLKEIVMPDDREETGGSAVASDPAAAAAQHAAQIEALKVDVEDLTQSLARIAGTAKGLASDQYAATVAELEETLKRNVFVSVGIAAFAGYLWGRTR